MGCIKSSFFLANLDQYIRIVFVISTTADRVLLVEQLKAVITGRAEVDLSLAAFAEL